MHHVLLYSDSFLYWCLEYICEGIFDLRIYVVVTSLYPWDRGVKPYETKIWSPRFVYKVEEDDGELEPWKDQFDYVREYKDQFLQFG